MMFSKPFDQVGKTDIDALVSSQIPEGRELDYKEQLPGNTLDDKREYLYDLTSLANTLGGFINADKEIQRLESFQLAGVERRVPSVRIKPIEGFPKGPILLVQVLRSWAAPHIVTLGGIHRFYARGERGKYLMDWHQIRSSFAVSESLPEKVRAFRHERLARIADGESLPTEMAGSARAVLHVFPISAVDPSASVDILRIRSLPGSLPPPGWKSASGWNGSPNLDGFAQMIDHVSYVQLFRDAAIEAVDSYLLNWGNGHTIPFPTLEKKSPNKPQPM